ncbi:MerR family transcriptional regulator [Kytococcus sp. Marseille-QA3725]
MTESQWDHEGSEDLTVGQAAELLGVTVRTLHHYEQIGLAGASNRSWSGYRLYAPQDMAVLRRVVFLRRLGLSLDRIREVLTGGDVTAELRSRREEVMGQVEQLTGVLDAIDTALEAEMNNNQQDNGGYRISRDEQREVFGSTFAENLDDYQAEAEQNWGDNPEWARSMERAKQYDKAQWQRISAESEQAMTELAAAMQAGEPANSQRSMDAAESHRQHISRWFYECTPQIHRGLGELYVTDPRFTATYEDVAEGLAAYARDAHAANADRLEA